MLENRIKGVNDLVVDTRDMTDKERVDYFGDVHQDSYVLQLKDGLPVNRVFVGEGYGASYLGDGALFCSKDLGSKEIIRHEILHSVYGGLSREAQREVMDAYMVHEPNHRTLLNQVGSNPLIEASRMERLTKLYESKSSLFNRSSMPLKGISSELAKTMKPGEYVERDLGEPKLTQERKTPRLDRYVKISEQDERVLEEALGRFQTKEQVADEEKNFLYTKYGPRPKPTGDVFINVADTVDEYIAHGIMYGDGERRLPSGIVEVLRKHGFFDRGLDDLAKEVEGFISRRENGLAELVA
jgi:hypothetical protein